MADGKFQDLIRLFRQYEVKFRLVPLQLTGFQCDTALTWAKVKFDEANASQVPDSRGVYAFIVEGPSRSLPPNAYVMYIGKAGDGSHSLRKRFRDYFQDKKRPKRPSIYRMLNQWGAVLSFYFAKIDDKAVALKPVEEALNDALLPPFVKNDFSADVRSAIHAF
jgi:hypothetical protein